MNFLSCVTQPPRMLKIERLLNHGGRRGTEDKIEQLEPLNATRSS
jgi:hypothetical protein